MDETNAKMDFARTMVAKDLGETASSVTDDCFKYGVTYGCDTGCPQLLRGECELMQGENKGLYKQAILESNV